MFSPPITSFSKARALAVDVFQADLRSVCGLFDVEPAGPCGRVRGAVRLRRRARLDVAEVSLDAARVSRGARAISADPGAHYFAIFQTEGRCLIQQAGRANLLSPGDLVIVDAAQPSEFRYDGAFSRQTSFHLPREEMRSRFGTSFDAWAELSQARSWAPMISGVANKVMQTEDRETCAHLEESLLSLLGAALRDISSQPVERSRQGTEILSKALERIDAQCSDPDFSVHMLAESLGVSARTLQRHFHQIGETPGVRILQARLERAYNRLVGACADRGESVTTIAYDAGFSDLSYFHRVFRQRYGATPGALRARQ